MSYVSLSWHACTKKHLHKRATYWIVTVRSKIIHKWLAHLLIVFHFTWRERAKAWAIEFCTSPVVPWWIQTYWPSASLRASIAGWTTIDFLFVPNLRSIFPGVCTKPHSCWFCWLAGISIIFCANFAKVWTLALHFRTSRRRPLISNAANYIWTIALHMQWNLEILFWRPIWGMYTSTSRWSLYSASN